MVATAVIITAAFLPRVVDVAKRAFLYDHNKLKQPEVGNDEDNHRHENITEVPPEETGMFEKVSNYLLSFRNFEKQGAGDNTNASENDDAIATASREPCTTRPRKPLNN